MNMKKKYLLYLFVLFLVSCKFPVHRGYNITNLSRDTICVYFATGYYLMGPTAYPDTLLPLDRQLQDDGWPFPRMLSQELEDDWILPCSKRELYDRLLWIDDRNHGEVLPHDTFSVFFISKDTLRKYGYDDVRENNRILVRYDLSRQETEMLGYSFTYPPQEIMRNMKMSPPFSWFEEHEVW